MMASHKRKDLKRGGVPFIILGIAMPALFSILCAVASSIAVPAVSRLAITEASPTLPPSRPPSA